MHVNNTLFHDIKNVISPQTVPHRTTRTVLAHPGTQHSFELARQLQQRRQLGRFWTGIAYDPNGAIGNWIKLLPARVRRKLTNRCLDGVSSHQLRLLPLLECRALFRMRMGHSPERVIFERNMAFQRRIPAEELLDSDVIIGFNGASWLLAEKAATVGRPFILDQTTAHPHSFQQVLVTLRQQFPDWVDGAAPANREFLAVQKAEHHCASRIVVASSFARRTLIQNGISAEKIVINPYGVDLKMFFPVSHPDSSRVLRFLFVGATTASKGVPLLLKAWASLAPKNAELWLVGAMSRRGKAVPAVRGVRFIGKIPHRELSNVFRQCDVFVFPSYFEGFGLVLLEAMASGLPIISTNATAAPDLITDGVQGYTIPVGNAEALRHTMHRFISSSVDIQTMSRAARATAESFSWDSYGNRWAELLQQVIDTNTHPSNTSSP